MKPKNKIKLHKSVGKVISEATAFVNAAIELHKLKTKPIPEYAKGAKEGGLMFVSQGSEKETIVTPNGDVVKPQGKNVVLSKPLGSYIYSQEHWDEKLKHILNAKNVVYEGGRNSGRTHFYEDWSKQLNEYLKGKGFKNDDPFGMAPIEYKVNDFEKTMLEIDRKLLNACKGSKCNHRNVTTSTYYELSTGKIIFTVKRCNNCNIDLLK